MATLSIRWIVRPEHSQNRRPSRLATTGRHDGGGRRLCQRGQPAGQFGQGEDALQDADRDSGWGVTPTRRQVTTDISH